MLDKVQKRWDEYCQEVRAWPEWTVIHFLKEHPTYDWRSPEALAKDSGLSLTSVNEILHALVVRHVVRERADGLFGLAARLDDKIDEAGDHSLPCIDPTTCVVKKTALDDLEIILGDACLKLQEAASLNRRLRELEQDVRGEQKAHLR